MGESTFGELRLKGGSNHSSTGAVGTATGQFIPGSIDQFPVATMIIAWHSLVAMGQTLRCDSIWFSLSSSALCVIQLGFWGFVLFCFLFPAAASLTAGAVLWIMTADCLPAA